MRTNREIQNNWIEENKGLWAFLAVLIAFLGLLVSILMATKETPINIENHNWSSNNQTNYNQKETKDNNNKREIQTLKDDIKDTKKNISNGLPQEEHPTKITKQPMSSMMVGKEVELRQENNIGSIVLCTLKPSDYITPINIASSKNRQWCLIRVDDSESCINSSEGYIPLVILSGNCKS